MSEYEVVKSDVDGWDVRRKGESQALTNHATKELAEEAAKVEQEVEEKVGDGSAAVDVRQGPFSDGPGDELDAKRTLLSAGVVLGAVIALIVIISLVVSLTNFPV